MSFAMSISDFFLKRSNFNLRLSAGTSGRRRRCFCPCGRWPVWARPHLVGAAQGPRRCWREHPDWARSRRPADRWACRSVPVIYGDTGRATTLVITIYEGPSRTRRVSRRAEPRAHAEHRLPERKPQTGYRAGDTAVGTSHLCLGSRPQHRGSGATGWKTVPRALQFGRFLGRQRRRL